VWEGGFEPFGADYANAESAGVFLRFPGQWVDGLMTEGGFYNVHRWYQAGTGRYGRVDPLGLVDAALYGGGNFEGQVTQLFGFAEMNPITFFDPLGQYTLGPTANPASANLDKFLKCLEKCIGHSFQVNSTSDGQHAGPDHSAGEAADIQPKSTGVPSKKVFCCAAQCHAGRCLDERFKPGGKFSRGPHYHVEISTPNRAKRNDCEPCKVLGPGGRCR